MFKKTKQMIRLVKLISTNSAADDDDNISQLFARGFDDFVVSWPPVTNTTSIDDDK